MSYKKKSEGTGPFHGITWHGSQQTLKLLQWLQTERREAEITDLNTFPFCLESKHKMKFIDQIFDKITEIGEF